MDQAKLLKDLRGQVAALETDLRERSESVDDYRTALNLEYAAAFNARRIAATYTVWRDERITQVAVAWVLATVFVRFCEDNGLIEAAWIAGLGERLREAEDRHGVHFQHHPEQNDRDWLIAAIRHLASTNETVAGLFDEAHNPLWEMDISYEAATALLAFWRRLGPDGEIVHDFTDPEWNTRFLGDLYQNLSESARKTYALLQTPEFVEEFILELTLEPAVKEFGLSPEWRYRPSKWPGPEGETPTGLRTIDPACGSGHFLLGIFHRLLEKWKEAEPGTDRWELIRRTLESVHGCDKNPFAVAIARFRLLLAALRAAGTTLLDQTPSFPINIAVGDSLLHGRGAEFVTDDLFTSEGPFTYTTEDIWDFATRCDLLGVSSYHVVVGNPPYITVKDKQENANYRAYSAATGKYALSVPFAQRILGLAIRAGGSDRKIAGFTGQITANSFMKREFGKKLIEEFFNPTVDLSHIIDTSGAYIPGHGTPTVILIGRNRHAYIQSEIRAILGIRGEPSQPNIAAEGCVWSAIQTQVNQPGSESEWISSVNLGRKNFALFPWNLSGGGTSAVVSQLGKTHRQLHTILDRPIGPASFPGQDDVFILSRSWFQQRTVPNFMARPLIIGEIVRDWHEDCNECALAPYSQDQTPVPLIDSSDWGRHLWTMRTIVGSTVGFDGKHRRDSNDPWWTWYRWVAERYRTPLSLTFAFVATHNHFVLDRGGKVFNRSAPVIKLPENSTEDDHLALLGLLNSSTACFWLKQVSQDKGNRGGERGTGRYAWESFFEFTGTKLKDFPIPPQLPLELGKALDGLGKELAAHEPSAVCADGIPARERLNTARQINRSIRTRMIALQEELDWRVYSSFGLLSREQAAQLIMGDLDAIPEVELGERAFELEQAARSHDDEAIAQWYIRHRSRPVTKIPEYWPAEYQRIVQARIDLIQKRNRDIGLIERPEYKRRWASETWEIKEKAALKNWLLDRCEREDLWFGLRDGLRHPRTLTVSQLADRFRADAEMLSVAALYASDHLGKRDLPLVAVLAEIVKDEHVPYLAALRYKDSGLSKRADWEEVWDKQREEDRTGKRLDIAVPPKYTTADFRKPSYWSHRGKLDVPKERFISYPGASPDADDTLLLGWAGWDHKDQAQALVNLVNDRTEQAAWDTDRLAPLLAGLLEVMPWVRQWHGEYDADWEGVPAEEFQAFLDGRRGKHGLSEETLRAWRPATGRGRKKTS